MKAWLLKSYDGLDGLEFSTDAETPTPASNEVLIKLHYAALNPADHYLAKKMYPARPAFPHILGRDGVGTVMEVGKDVTKWKQGDMVALLRGEAGVNKPGTFAEFACIDAECLVSVPDGWTQQQAAAAPLVYLTAYQALTQWEDIQGGTVLVTGASGGVGVASIMLARARGQKTIGLSRSPKKAKELVELGADLVLDPGETDLVSKIKEFTGKEGVSLAVDNIGGDLFPKLVATLGHRGAISCVGRLAGPVPEFNTATLFFKRLRIGGVAVGSYSPQEAQQTWNKVLGLLNKSNQRPLIDHVYQLEELKDAFNRLSDGPMGKVLVQIV